TSLYPVRLSPQAELAHSIKTIKEQLRAVPDKGIGYGALRYLGDAAIRAQLQALAQPRITFNYLGQFDGSFDGDNGALFAPSGEPVGEEKSPDTPLGNWLTLNSQVYDNRLNMAWTFSREMFTEAQVEQLAQYCREALEQLIEHCSSGEHLGLTPSDFPLTSLTQQQLDALPIPV
ncbi:MAG: condensation domain-containing protein, partial [Pseudomonas sp.]